MVRQLGLRRLLLQEREPIELPIAGLNGRLFDPCLRKTEYMHREGSPTLKALKAFETAVRLNSLTLAARELNVSVPAISFQVRNVEEALDLSLFKKVNGRSCISTAAAALGADLTPAFGAIDRAVGRARREGVERSIVTVSVLPNFAAIWLFPRLAEFRSANPGIDVRISTSEDLVDFEKTAIDCAIRCGPGGWAGVVERPLFPQRLTPMLHRSYSEVHGAPAEISQLSRHSIITNSRHPNEWEFWLRHIGMEKMELPNQQAVYGRDLVLAAVIAGLGIGILDRSVVKRELARGDLIQPFAASLDTGWQHHIVVPTSREPNDACIALVDWLASKSE